MPEEKPSLAQVARVVRILARGLLTVLEEMEAMKPQQPATIDDLAKRMHDDGYLANEGTEPFKDFLARLHKADLAAQERKSK
jgi:hypothetical protein